MAFWVPTDLTAEFGTSVVEWGWRRRLGVGFAWWSYGRDANPSPNLLSHPLHCLTPEPALWFCGAQYLMWTYVFIRRTVWTCGLALQQAELAMRLDLLYAYSASACMYSLSELRAPAMSTYPRKVCVLGSVATPVKTSIDEISLSRLCPGKNNTPKWGHYTYAKIRR